MNLASYLGFGDCSPSPSLTETIPIRVVSHRPCSCGGTAFKRSPKWFDLVVCTHCGLIYAIGSNVTNPIAHSESSM